MASGEMSEAEFTDFLLQTFRRIGAYCRGGALIYSFMDWRHMSEILAAGRAASLDLLNLCVWAKTNGGMGSLYRSRHELVFVFSDYSDSWMGRTAGRPSSRVPRLSPCPRVCDSTTQALDYIGLLQRSFPIICS
jgi:hypothetical protein